ncbi:MAG: MFS transporter, partial [Methanotrichaceae archaeon]
SISDLTPELRKFVAIASLFAIGNFSYMFFILRAQEFFTGMATIGDPLLLYAFFNVVYAVFSLPVGIWSDRIGRKNVLTLGFALFAVTAAGFASVTSAAGLVFLFALYGFVFAIIDASQSAFVSDLSQATLRSTSLGAYYSAVGVASIFSGLVAGELWALFGPGATFIFGAAASALAAVLLWRMKDIKEIL